MANVILFGAPGSGKGTQAEIIKNKFNLVHISTGDLFRRNIKKGTELGKLARKYIDEGNLVPDEVTIALLKDELLKKKDVSDGFIFDGFPRTQEQAKALDKLLKNNKMKINAMIFINVTEDVLISRLLNRGKESNRVDDQSEERIKNRLNEYRNKTKPLISYYENQNKLHRVKGVGDIQVISNKIAKLIEQL